MGVCPTCCQNALLAALTQLQTRLPGTRGQLFAEGQMPLVGGSHSLVRTVAIC